MPRSVKPKRKSRRGAHLNRKQDRVELSTVQPEVEVIRNDELDFSGNNSDSYQLPPGTLESPSKIFEGSYIDDPPEIIVENSCEINERKLKLLDDGPPVGRRIVSIQGIQDALQKAKNHGLDCEDGILQVIGEKKNGLHSTLVCECVGCRTNFKFKINCDKGSKSLPINDAAVWGTYCAKSNFESTSHFITTLEIPAMSFNKYQKHEKKMIDDWEIALTRELKEAGEEERKLATEFIEIDGKQVGCIDVCVDGGWGKRSYGHGMNSLGGVAVIVGIKTKKVLFMGVRNKYCSICSSCEIQGKEAPGHKCFKNWGTSASSTSMEADIILEGFKSSVEFHGLAYKRLLGDGDSSVFHTVLTKVNYPGIVIEKIDCINHAEKRFNSKIFALLKQTKTFKIEDRKLLKKLQPRFGKALRGAIIYNNKNQPLTSASTLKEDIVNIPFHLYGQHDKCKDYFCTEDRKKEQNLVLKVIDSNLWTEIGVSIARLANISNRLIHNLTSNLAERFMAQGAAFMLGKRPNVYQRGGYKTRMMAATFAYNKGPHFRSNILQKVTKRCPPPLWRKMQKKHDKKKSYLKPKKFKKKSATKNKNTDPSFVGDADYGSNPAEPDISEPEMNKKVADLKKQLEVTAENQLELERKTVGQSQNDCWIRERKNRITASSASAIFSLRDSTSNTNQLVYLLGYKILSNVKSLDHGIKEEAEAIKAYMKERSCFVQPCGLFVSLENGIFSCSPDGLVGDDGIIEVKCPISMVGFCPDEMISVKGKSSSYLQEITSTDSRKSLQLKRKHPYFRQICFQLHVTGRKWCDFIVYSFKLESDGKSTTKVPFPPFVERIYKNEETEKVWEEMEPKLSKFWKEDLAPEIVDSRYQRNLPFRQPKYRIDAQELNLLKKQQKQTVKSKNHENKKKGDVLTASNPSHLN